MAVVPPFGRDPLAADQHDDRRAEAELSTRMEQAIERHCGGIEVSRVLEEGDPASVLSECSEHLDMLFLGSRGYGPVRRALLGSVSQALMRGAHCPVVVVPRPAGSRSEIDPLTRAILR